MNAFVLVVLSQFPMDVFDNAAAFKEFDHGSYGVLSKREVKGSPYPEHRIVVTTETPAPVLCDAVFEMGTTGDTDGLAFGVLSDLDLKLAASRFNTRFWGAVAVAKHGAIHLPPGGSFTITNGMLAHRPMKGMPIVTASAMAAEGLTRGLAVDLSPVRVNCVCPGLIETELFDRYGDARREMLNHASHFRARRTEPRADRPGNRRRRRQQSERDDI